MSDSSLSGRPKTRTSAAVVIILWGRRSDQPDERFATFDCRKSSEDGLPFGLSVVELVYLGLLRLQKYSVNTFKSE